MPIQSDEVRKLFFWLDCCFSRPRRSKQTEFFECHYRDAFLGCVWREQSQADCPWRSAFVGGDHHVSTVTLEETVDYFVQLAYSFLVEDQP